MREAKILENAIALSLSNGDVRGAFVEWIEYTAAKSIKGPYTNGQRMAYLIGYFRNQIYHLATDSNYRQAIMAEWEQYQNNVQASNKK